MFNQGESREDGRTDKRKPSKTERFKNKSPSFKRPKIRNETEALFGDMAY